MAVTLPIGHLFLLVSFRNKTMSPTLKVYHNFVPFMTNLQGCISFLLPPDSFAKSCTRLHRFLQYMSSFWNSPGGGITTLDFNASNCIGHNGTGLWTSDKDSDGDGSCIDNSFCFSKKCSEWFINQTCSMYF